MQSELIINRRVRFALEQELLDKNMSLEQVFPSALLAVCTRPESCVCVCITCVCVCVTCVCVCVCVCVYVCVCVCVCWG